ncbi:hypothetical protein J6590_031772 [Homalodisca vitripennis]|nr:hypothetical protein J6590_031772 [Homalodisca vitripennis]
MSLYGTSAIHKHIQPHQGLRETGETIRIMSTSCGVASTGVSSRFTPRVHKQETQVDKFSSHLFRCLRPRRRQYFSISQWHSLQKLGKYPEKFFNYYRMSKASFDFLLDLVTPLLLKQDTNYRTAIGVGERLTITLR